MCLTNERVGFIKLTLITDVHFWDPIYHTLWSGSKQVKIVQMQCKNASSHATSKGSILHTQLVSFIVLSKIMQTV